MSTVLRLLPAVGYARLTMDDVAARAGVGKASLYRRWPTKDALVFEAIKHRFQEGGPPPPDTGSLRLDMLTYLRAMIRHRHARMESIYAVAGELLSNKVLAAALRGEVLTTMLPASRAIVQRAVDRGELPPGTDVDLLASVPLALLHHLRVRGEPIDERQAKRIVDQFFSPPPSPGARRLTQQSQLISH